jgi:thiol:disulfide interchange protein DsbD
MRRGLILTFLIFALVLWISPGSFKYYFDEEVVEVQIFRSFDRIHPGMDLKVALRVNILDTWHINSNIPIEDFMEATNVDIPLESSFSFSEIKYPEALTILLEFSERPLSVYEGEIFIGGVIPIPKDIALGKHNIPLRFTYQACNDSTCLPPKTLEKEILLTVVDKGTPIQRINTEIFTKLDMEASPNL